MKHDAAFEALKRANPEPDPAALRRDLREPPQPTTSVILDAPPTKPSSPRAPARRQPSPRLRPAVAGGLAVAMLAVVLLVPWVDGRNVLDSLWSSPVEISIEYLEARNAYDAVGADALIADDAVIVDQPRMERSELELAFESLRVYEMKFEPFECEHRAGSTLVTCTYQMDTRLSQIVGYPPVTGRIQFLVDEGRITYLVHDFNYDDYAPNVFEPYISWLNEEHPGVRQQLFLWADGVLTPILTRESLDLATRYLDEYDRSVNG